MGMEQWEVIPADDLDGDEQFILRYVDIATARTQPFTHTSAPMSESELRIELEKLNVSAAEADAAIASARAAKSAANND